ncbi:MAG: energy transducer TonB [Wenzhouxiangellaceae bacterium]
MKNRFSVAGVVVVLAAVFSTPHASETEVVCATPDQDVQSLSITYPPYPYSAMLFCIEGHARYEFTINPDGTTSNINVIESEPEGAFDAAGDVIRFWTFEPRCRDGVPVERKATRNIEFQLDQVDSRNCPQNLPEDLLDVQIALFSLYQRTDAAIRNQQAPLTPMAVHSALEEPFASIERAHRRHLNDRLELEQEWRKYPLWNLKRMIGPSHLAGGQSFSMARVALDIYESGRHELYRKWPEIVMELRRELVEVSEMPGVTPEAYDLLLAGDLRQPEGGIGPNHELMALEASVFSAHRELLDWLELHGHEWDVEDNRFRFASDGLEQAYERRIQAIRALWQTWDREFSMPRRIYWSGF